MPQQTAKSVSTTVSPNWGFTLRLSCLFSQRVKDTNTSRWLDAVEVVFNLVFGAVAAENADQILRER